MVSCMERVPYGPIMLCSFGVARYVNYRAYGSPGTCIVNCAISQFTDPGGRGST